MAVRAIDIVHHFAPQAQPNYRQAFEQGDPLLATFEINSPLRLAHFMAQVFHETDALTLLVESGRYQQKGLARMWDAGNWHRYFADRDACLAIADVCAADGGETLFNLVYGNRMGNGPPLSGDGWRYRGRGIMQTTGRESYRRFGQECGVDFEGNPDLVVSAQHALKPALFEWRAGHLNTAADHDDIEVITRRINGGLVGLDKRKAWLARILPFAKGKDPIEDSIEWKVQEKLNALGYKKVKPDGVVGSKTRTAIIDYRARHGLSPGNMITSELVQSLGLN